MSYSTQRVTSDGTLETLAISIEYFDRSEISILSDGVLITTGWTWVGTSDKTIQFAVPVANGVEITVLRSTDLSAIRHQFSLGAAFKAATVDEDFKQILHIAQEARENATITDIYQDLDMHGFKVKNVGAGTAPLDLVNQTQLTANNATVQGYVDDAEDFAEASEASALRSEAAALAAEAVGDVATQVHAAAEKTTPANDDEFGLVDSAASNVLKRFKWSSLVSALTNQFTSSLDTSGYQKLPSGLIIQWGSIYITSVSGASSIATATFPIAFTSFRIGVLKIRSSASTLDYSAYDNNGSLKTGVEINLVSTSGAGGIPVPVEYIFIGV